MFLFKSESPGRPKKIDMCVSTTAGIRFYQGKYGVNVLQIGTSFTTVLQMVYKRFGNQLTDHFETSPVIGHFSNNGFRAQ